MEALPQQMGAMMYVAVSALPHLTPQLLSSLLSFLSMLATIIEFVNNEFCA